MRFLFKQLVNDNFFLKEIQKRESSPLASIFFVLSFFFKKKIILWNISISYAFKKNYIKGFYRNNFSPIKKYLIQSKMDYLLIELRKDGSSLVRSMHHYYQKVTIIICKINNTNKSFRTPKKIFKWLNLI